MYEKSKSDMLDVVNDAYFACKKAKLEFDHDSETYAKITKAQTLLLEAWEELATKIFSK
jgi:hypothetical protein